MEKVLNNGLILPQSGYEITSKEEMSYEDGKGNCRFSICITYDFIKSTISKLGGSILGSLIGCGVKAAVIAVITSKAAKAGTQVGACGGLIGAAIGAAVGTIAGALISWGISSITDKCWQNKCNYTFDLLNCWLPFVSFNYTWTWYGW